MAGGDAQSCVRGRAQRAACSVAGAPGQALRGPLRRRGKEDGRRGEHSVAQLRHKRLAQDRRLAPQEPEGGNGAHPTRP